jgi:hypothetical protein
MKRIAESLAIRLRRLADRIDPGPPRKKPCGHPDGHFYSPVVDVEDIEAREREIWPAEPDVLGIDFNDASHREVLGTDFPQHLASYDYPEQLDEVRHPGRFYTRNSQFGWLDARALHVLLLAWRPRRIIEVGSGYSSLLTAEVNRFHFGGAIEFTCIETYPRPFLRAGIAGITRLIEKRVERLPLDTFAALEPGDVLFIDSSHVAKTGSDVNYLYFEVLPRLASGVVVHIHDIHLPHDYPREWVIDENRSWNEQYLVRALLMYSQAYKIRFGCRYAFHRFPDLVRSALAHPRGCAFGGGSLWLERG